MNFEWDYEGKTCVVTGAASGMGRATVEALTALGAKVYAMDIRPVDVPGIEAYIPVDLSEKNSIVQAFSCLPEKIDCFFSVAGLRGATLPFMTVAKINLFANKLMLEELLVSRMKEGGAISIVTSAVGVGWELPGNKKFYEAVLNAEGWDEAVQALENTGLTKANGGLAYVYTKLALNALVAKVQATYARKHVRVNALMPGDTATNFGKEDNLPKGMEEAASAFVGYAGRQAEAREMAMPLLFLASGMASYISGTYLFADYGLSCEIMAGLRQSPTGGTLEQMFAHH